jgi:hypothetical protein
VGRTEAAGALVDDQLGCAVRIADNVIVPQPDNHPSLIFEKRCPLPVVIGRLFRMLAAVDLDRQLGLRDRPDR